MRFIVQLVADVGEGSRVTNIIAAIERPGDGLSIDDLGLTLAESKAILAKLQASITGAQAAALVDRKRACPCCRRLRRLKDHRTIAVRTLFGKLALPSPRFERCRCEDAPGVAAPIVAALPERVTPDLLALETRWASLAAYGRSSHRMCSQLR